MARPRRGAVRLVWRGAVWCDVVWCILGGNSQSHPYLNSLSLYSGACVGGNRVDHYCRPGHEGPLCAVCSSDHYFHTVKKQCLLCNTDLMGATTLEVATSALAIFMLLLTIAIVAICECHD